MIDIILASYNGELYLERQLDSIASQSFGDWHLYIRDDCSNDNTLEIIQEFAKKYPDKTDYSVRESNSGNPRVVFFELLKQTRSELVVFCDQDDVWNRDKLRLINNAYKNCNKNQPTLIHTDLTVIDEKNRILAHSMLKQQHIKPKRTGLNKLLAQNVVTGCTMAINRALADILREPDGLPVHDWWIAAVASITGRIVYINKSTVYYRKHSNNQCGAQNMNSLGYLMSRLADSNRARYMLSLGYVMARELLRLYKSELSTKQKQMLLDYACLKGVGKLNKLFVCCKYGIWKSGLIRKIGQVFYM